MEKALKANGKSTKTEAVEAALKLLVQLNGQAKIRESRGTLDFYPDVLEERKRRNLDFEKS